MREDLNLRSYAESKGFKVDDKNGKIGATLSFEKGRFNVWGSGESYLLDYTLVFRLKTVPKTWWRRAELIDGKYRNHKTFTTLKEALDSIDDNLIKGDYHV